jgi:hypothetical protein
VKPTASATPDRSFVSGSSKDSSDTIDLSLDSISPGTKRSYDNSTLVESQSSTKRSKYDTLVDKENHSIDNSPSTSAKDKGKSKAIISKVKDVLHFGSSTTRIDKEDKESRVVRKEAKDITKENVVEILDDEEDEDEDEWLAKATEPSKVRYSNPYAQLDIDYPAKKSPSVTEKLDQDLIKVCLPKASAISSTSFCLLSGHAQSLKNSFHSTLGSCETLNSLSPKVFLLTNLWLRR